MSMLSVEYKNIKDFCCNFRIISSDIFIEHDEHVLYQRICN